MGALFENRACADCKRWFRRTKGSVRTLCKTCESAHKSPVKKRCQQCHMLFWAVNGSSRYICETCTYQNRSRIQAERHQYFIATGQTKAPIYRDWTEDGVMCLKSNHDCDNCYIWQIYQRRDGHGCYQKEAVESLKERKVPIPQKLKQLYTVESKSE